MKDALCATHFCDVDHPLIGETAAVLASSDGNMTDTARNTFYFVRDKVITGYDLYEVKASRILERRVGICWGKALLLTALLRRNGIPARFATIPVHRGFIRPLIGKMYLLANSPYNHCAVLAYLHSRWNLLDPVLDMYTYEALFLPAGVDWHIDWNGKDDCRLYTESIAGEVQVHTDIDRTIRRSAGNNELPAILAGPLYRWLNRRIWKRVAAAGISGFQMPVNT